MAREIDEVLRELDAKEAALHEETDVKLATACLRNPKARKLFKDSKFRNLVHALIETCYQDAKETLKK